MDNAPNVNSVEWWDEYFAASWDEHEGRKQTRYFMESVLASLSPVEAAFLGSRPLAILDWGCAFGDGVDVLNRNFPHSTVTGLDFSLKAIEEARRSYPQAQFVHSKDGEIREIHDVIITSNCLEHFESPLERVRTQLAMCRSLYVALVPYNEFPLSPYHRAQFREESFPEHLDGFARLCARTIETEARFWPGRQLLVVYGSVQYVQDRVPEHAQEVEKWNRYYESLPLPEEDEITKRFNAQLVECVSAVVPKGARILEAGCGGGWQSLALARAGYQVTLLDFSPQAIAYTKRLFERERVPAEFIQADMLTPAEPAFDLVFNAGVLEHYGFEDQVRFLRGMASRSRQFVLVLVPNRLCYWYWIWRQQISAEGGWAWGKEVPRTSLAKVFKAAGLEFLGERFLGQDWTEHFIRSALKGDPGLSEQVIQLHRSPVLSPEQKGYLLASLGATGSVDQEITGWDPPVERAEDSAELIASLADTLALQIQRQRELAERNRKEAQLEKQLAEERAQTEKQLAEERAQVEKQLAEERAQTEKQLAERAQVEKQLAEERAQVERQLVEARRQDADLERRARELARAREESADLTKASAAILEEAERRRVATLNGMRAYHDRFQDALETYRHQRAWQVMLLLRQLYSQLVREGWSGIGRCAKFLLSIPFKGIPPLTPYDLKFPAIHEFLPERLVEPITVPPSIAQAPGLRERKPEVRAEKRRSKYDLIILPVFDFDYRFQRPQQMAVQFAAAGHRVFWVSPSRFLPESSALPYELHELSENLWEVQVRGAIPNIYVGRMEPEHVLAAADDLESLYENEKVGESCAMLQLPFWRQVGLELRRRRGAVVVFDCIDEWETFPKIGEFTRREQAPLVREADVLVVTGQGLFDMYSARGAHPILIRNGADFDFFRQPPAGNPLGEIPKPVIGYFGAIADWFDFELLRRVAQARPQYSFVLIGGLGLEKDVLGDSIPLLRELPNVHLLGHKPYREMPAWLSGFDVCIIPFVLNRVTAATDPVKMYEYFSQGKPMVATDMRELAQCQDLVYIGRGVEDFAAKLDAAVAESDSALRQRRIDFASANSWRARFDAMDRAVGRALSSVSILVVSYNSAEFLRPCLDSVLRNTSGMDFEVVAIDNASSDGSAAILRDYASRESCIRATCLTENIGFASANNLAARQARGAFLVLLNADTVVPPRWLEILLRHLRQDSSIGVIVPVTNCAGNEAKINVTYQDQNSMHALARELAEARRGMQLEIDSAPLFCAAIPTRIWKTLGALDETFQVGMFEDDDFSHRVRRAGYRVVTAEDCFVHHFGQGSFGRLPRETFTRIFEENRGRFEQKWGMAWKPHQYRPGIDPENGRFTPAQFLPAEAPVKARASTS